MCGEVSPCTVKSAMKESGVHTVSYSVGQEDFSEEPMPDLILRIS